MWINNNISKPLRKGYYKTLVDFDGLGNLIEVEDEFFNGADWDLYNSSVQFILFWRAEKEDYKIIIDKIEIEKDKYLKQMEEASKNFGGL